MNAGIERWVQITRQGSRTKRLTYFGRPVNLIGSCAVISACKVMIIPGEIPAQSIVKRQMRGQFEIVLSIEPPSFLKLIQVEGLAGRAVQILMGFQIKREAAPNRSNVSNATNQNGVQLLSVGEIRSGLRSQHGVEVVGSRIACNKSQR